MGHGAKKRATAHGCNIEENQEHLFECRLLQRHFWSRIYEFTDALLIENERNVTFWTRPHTMRYLVFRCYNEQAHLFRMHYSQAASQCRCEKMLAPLQHLKCRCMLKHGIPHQNAPQMHRLADHTVASERKDVVCFLRVSVLGSEFSMFASCLGELSNVI